MNIQWIAFIVYSYLHFLCSYLLKGFVCFFFSTPIKYEWFLNRSIWPIDGTLTGSITSSQNKSRSNGNEECYSIC